MQKDKDKEVKSLKPSRRSAFAVLEDAAMSLERIRVGAQVRLKHLEKYGRVCVYTQEMLEKVLPLEEWADDIVATLIGGHPVYWWVSHIRGLGRENISKLVGEIENFGRYYELGDPQIPEGINREPEEYIYRDKATGKEEVKIGIWVEGIERLSLPSKQRVYLGHAPGLKRKRGQKHSYNSRGKTLLWRVGRSLIRANSKYADEYRSYKEYLKQRVIAKGATIAPTPKERYCPECEQEVILKAGMYCPDCGGPLSSKAEPPGVLYLGHLDLMARRKMQQLFSDHLNVVWRRTLGLPVRELPYAVEYKGHSTIIHPEDMMDKACGKKDCAICAEYGLV